MSVLSKEVYDVYNDAANKGFLTCEQKSRVDKLSFAVVELSLVDNHTVK